MDKFLSLLANGHTCLNANESRRVSGNSNRVAFGDIMTNRLLLATWSTRQHVAFLVNSSNEKLDLSGGGRASLKEMH